MLPAFEPEPRAADRVGTALLITTMAAFVLIGLPVIWRGAPLADDFINCTAPKELGLSGAFSVSWQLFGAMRPARFLEMLLTGAVCRHLPFGVAIAVPLLLTLGVAVLARALLRDLGVPRPWADIGGAFWMLQPLGTETGLWPAALHVPLGLALALGAVRLYARGWYGWAALANLGAALSVEQVILPLCLCAWLFAPIGDRRRAALMSATIGAAVLATFLWWPGTNPRMNVTLTERLAGLAARPEFYVGFPAVGLGLHSIPLAIQWAWPWGMVALIAGTLTGWLLGRPLAAHTRAVPRGEIWHGAMAVAALVVLTNVIVVLAVPQQGSPRVFTPTWLVLAMGAAAGAGSVKWRHPRLVGAAGGLFAAGAVLSLAFSVSVRLRSADFVERAASIVAARVPEGATVAVCDVRRTAVQPAPRGAFAVHEFVYDWAAEAALLYYAERHATVHLAGELWEEQCPPRSSVDAVIDFDELTEGARP
jgi:hypothetical protein